jgi:hypothetical protein
MDPVELADADRDTHGIVDLMAAADAPKRPGRLLGEARSD